MTSADGVAGDPRRAPRCHSRWVRQNAPIRQHVLSNVEPSMLAFGCVLLEAVVTAYPVRCLKR
jgi:hypothetical protein